MIFYFTATGNSKYVAKKIEKGFPGEAIDIVEKFYKKEFIFRVREGEKVFFVFPTYYGTLPKIVIEFIREVSFESKNYSNVSEIDIIGIATCGGSASGTDIIFKKLIRQKDLQVKGFYEVVMPDFYIALFNPPLIEKQKMILKRADKKIEEIVDNINFNYRKPYESTYLQRLVSLLGRFLYRKGRPTKKFFVKDSCISCGKCERDCIDKIIKLDEKGVPIWTKGRCSHCMACINKCPKEAIEYGKKTLGKGRYETK